MIVGIDLGTTNSLVSVWEDGEPRLIPSVHGSAMTPSVVGLDDAGVVLVGESAQARLSTHPAMTASGFKRLMGTGRKVRLGAQSFRPEELSAIVLRALKADVERALRVEVAEAVISVPAHFNEVQRKATIHAGRLAGLEVERLVNEPTAAALAHGFRADDEAQLLVFDLGGGTFDVSIVELFSGVMEVRATAGDMYLGGDDFTLGLAELIRERLDLSNGSTLEPGDPKSELRRLTAVAERAKRTLTTADTARVCFDPTGTGDVREVTVTRADFEARCAPLLERVREPLRQAMQDARIRPGDLDAVILVGGATRVPMVRRAATSLLGRFPRVLGDPDHTVGLGVGVQAALKARRSELAEVVLTDVAPYTLGVESLRRSGYSRPDRTVFTPIIERNTTVPASREERFFTVADGQTEIRIAIYQGESLLIEDNIFLEKLDLEVPAAPAGEQAVDVRFSYDVNGLLEVEATVVSTGATASVLVKGNATNLDDAEIARSLERLRMLKIHPRDAEQNLALIHRLNRLHAMLLGDDRRYVGDVLSAFLAALDTQDPRMVRRAQQTAQELLAIHDD